MIERTEITVELDSKDLAKAIRDYVISQGIDAPSYARIAIHTEDTTFPVNSTVLQPIHAVVTIKNGSKAVEAE